VNATINQKSDLDCKLVLVEGAEMGMIFYTLIFVVVVLVAGEILARAINERFNDSVILKFLLNFIMLTIGIGLFTTWSSIVHIFGSHVSAWLSGISEISFDGFFVTIKVLSVWSFRKFIASKLVYKQLQRFVPKLCNFLFTDNQPTGIALISNSVYLHMVGYYALVRTGILIRLPEGAYELILVPVVISFLIFTFMDKRSDILKNKTCQCQGCANFKNQTTKPKPLRLYR